MTISVQQSTATPLGLENLALGGGAPTAQPAPTTVIDSGSGTAATVLDLSSSANGALGSLSAGLVDAASIADAAVSAGTSIRDLLGQMRQSAQTASNPGLSDTDRANLNTAFQSALAQIQATVSQAAVGGVNLIDGSVSGSLNDAAAGWKPAALAGANLSANGPLIGLSSDASLNDPAQAVTIADQLSTAIGRVGDAVSQIGTQGQAIQDHMTLVAQAGLSANQGFDPGLDQDSARLQALAIQQQLAAGSSGVANQAPQTILALFR